MRDQLVPETDAHHLAFRFQGLAHEVGKARDPGVVVVDALPAAGNHVGIARPRVGVSRFNGVDGLEFERLAIRRGGEHVLEHPRVIAVPAAKPFHDPVCLQNADAHGVR